MSDKTDGSDKPVEPVAEAALEIETTTVEAKPVVAPPGSDPVTVKLVELGLTVEQIAEVKKLGAESVDDLAALTESDLTGFLPILKARKIVAALAPVEPPGAVAPTMSSVNFDSLLPSVPDDSSWLSALRANGVRKMDDSTVISAIRAALADRFGLYDIPAKLVKEMESYVDVTEEQVSDEFWTLRKQLTRKSYGDLFQAIEGLDGSFVTSGRKEELLVRITDNLWPAIISFNEQLGQWQESWMQGAANPAMMMAAIAGGAGGVGLPPGMMQPPDCGTLRDAAEALNDSLNRTFRGTGVQITAALAFEANQIKSMIENPRLPMLCGVPSRELLLKKLKVDVPPTYPRMEQNLTRFVLGIMQCDKVAGGNDELQYFGTLFMLGNQIPWGDLERGGFRNGPSNPAKRNGRQRPRGITEESRNAREELANF